MSAHTRYAQVFPLLNYHLHCITYFRSDTATTRKEPPFSFCPFTTPPSLEREMEGQGSFCPPPFDDALDASLECNREVFYLPTTPLSLETRDGGEFLAHYKPSFGMHYPSEEGEPFEHGLFPYF